MSKRFSLDLVANATDSLEHGLSHYNGERSSESDLKAALLLVFHATELLLKERLVRISPALILSNIDKAQADDAHTVAFSKLVLRLANFDVELDETDRDVVTRVAKIRNQVQHSQFDMDHGEVATELGEALKFVFKFMASELNLDPENELDPNLFHKARELIHTYEELLQQAEESIAKVLPGDPSELSIYTILMCPECTHEFVDEEGKCHFCREEFTIGACEICGVPTVETFCAQHVGSW